MKAHERVEAHCPKSWREVSLGSVAEVRFSSVDKLNYPSEEPIRLCNYIDVYRNAYITGDLEFMRASATQPEIDRFRLQVGDVIITKDSEAPYDIGIPAVVDYAAPDLVCGYHLGLIRSKNDEVDPTFLSKQLSHHRIARYFGRQANGLTRYGLPISAVTSAPVWLPARKEQEAIGTVLRLVDEAIAKTEAVIAKLKQVRAGLLHDLLTRGLDEHGVIRPPPAEAPHLYKDSPLGEIPRGWAVEALGGVMAAIFDYRGRTPLKLGMEWGGGDIPALSANNVEMGRINFKKETYYASQALYKRWMTQGDIEQGDVLITMEAPFGNIAQVPDVRCYILSQRVVLLRPKAELLAKDFLALQLMGVRFQRDMMRQSTGTTAVGIQRAKLETIHVLVPGSRDEQQAIAHAVNSVNECIEVEARELKKVLSVKAGIVNDLLTGRVRVPKSLAGRAEEDRP